jgi:L-alanine-DL-glutamate epimerase-like enolase superfamily enzyme
MPAPVSIAQIHVHSLRLRNGAEALVARVMTADGVPGFGFSLGSEAFPARDMAAWDALARSRNVPLYALFGTRLRERVAVGHENADGSRQLDPFALGSVEAVRAAAPNGSLVLRAPNAHPWELSYCAALAATLAGEVRIAVRVEPPAESIAVSDAPGIDIDWSQEPGFARLRWI